MDNVDQKKKSMNQRKAMVRRWRKKEGKFAGDWLGWEPEDKLRLRMAVTVSEDVKRRVL